MTPVQSVLETGGEHAASILSLFRVHLAVLGVVYLLVVGALVVALIRRRPPGDAARRNVIAGATALTTLILLGFLVANVVTGRQLAVASRVPPDALMIDVKARQWWWEVHYLAPRGSDEVVDANELHLPAGRPVLLRLTSSDVIHSFWVPSLQGKRDLIPGLPNYLTLRADRPGVYRGQCAEFCGFQHAKMALQVIVDPPEAFDAWLAHARQPPPAPADARATRGREIVEKGPCRMCHHVAGTEAGGSAGPDLSHLAARRTLAAGTLPNTRAELARWITDPQSIKPGSNMPPIALGDDDLQALLTYLEGLR